MLLFNLIDSYLSLILILVKKSKILFFTQVIMVFNIEMNNLKLDN